MEFHAPFTHILHSCHQASEKAHLQLRVDFAKTMGHILQATERTNIYFWAMAHIPHVKFGSELIYLLRRMG
jgi:hypothetical protein